MASALSTESPMRLPTPEVQAVVLATPHSLHVDQVAAVATAGKPVWCEKPLALTRARPRDRSRPAAKAGVAFGTRQQQALLRLDAGVEARGRAGAIGEVLHIEAHFCNEHQHPGDAAAGATIRASRRAAA